MTLQYSSKGATAHAWLASALEVDSAFPWQTALLDRLLDGEIPSSIDLPTGLGKTSFIAIWLIARALGAPLPRRLVYVVDRRAVIDQATAVAVALAAKLPAWMGQRPDIASSLGLARSTLDPVKLPISTLRGQLADNRAWLGDPSASAIILGTIDMIGSRLLFEGYGVSRRMRPYHAGLLGADSLVVLDEAHLVAPFDALVRSAERRRPPDGVGSLQPRTSEHLAVVPSLRRVSLSATGRHDPSTFRLGEADRTHPIVRRRLDAKKWLVTPTSVDAADLPSALAREAWELSARGHQPVRCILFCNSRDDAQKTELSLRKLAGKRAATQLFVGGRRVFERTQMEEWLTKHGFLAGKRAELTAPAFVVATSAGEVGVDLDADHMVSDVVAWERMVQRLGRVNRRGEGEATIIVLGTTRDKKTQEAFDKEPAKRDEKDIAFVARRQQLETVVSLLHELPLANSAPGTLEGARLASPSALVGLRDRGRVDAGLLARLERATTPDPLHPALTRPLLEAWSMTSLDAHTGRPEVQPWIRGWIDDEPETSVTWRNLLPLAGGGSALSPSDVTSFFEAANPHALEALETETSAVIRWLRSRLDALPTKRPKGEAGLDNRDWHPKGRERAETPDDTGPRPAESDVEASEADGETEKHVEPLCAGDIVAFILTADGPPIPLRGAWPDRPREARDLEEQLKRGRLVVDARLGGLSLGLLDADNNEAAFDVSDLEVGVPFRVHATGSPSETSRREELRLVTHATPEGQGLQWLVVERRTGQMPLTEEGRSNVGRAQLLDEHEACTEKWARAIGTRLALPPAYADVLALAARLHDEGKRAARWQRAFRAPKDGTYGKTTSRPNQQILAGYRHEFGSILRAENDSRVIALPSDLRDLCLHLIAAHHGNARPVLSTAACEEGPPSALDEHARLVALRFARLEAVWGPWGLAWWESLLRAADQQASRENDEGTPTSREASHG